MLSPAHRAPLGAAGHGDDWKANHGSVEPPGHAIRTGSREAVAAVQVRARRTRRISPRAIETKTSALLVFLFARVSEMFFTRRDSDRRLRFFHPPREARSASSARASSRHSLTPNLSIPNRLPRTTSQTRIRTNERQSDAERVRFTRRGLAGFAAHGAGALRDAPGRRRVLRAAASGAAAPDARSVRAPTPPGSRRGSRTRWRGRTACCPRSRAHTCSSATRRGPSRTTRSRWAGRRRGRRRVRRAGQRRFGGGSARSAGVRRAHRRRRTGAHRRGAHRGHRRGAHRRRRRGSRHRRGGVGAPAAPAAPAGRRRRPAGRAHRRRRRRRSRPRTPRRCACRLRRRRRLGPTRRRARLVSPRRALRRALAGGGGGGGVPRGASRDAPVEHGGRRGRWRDRHLGVRGERVRVAAAGAGGVVAAAGAAGDQPAGRALRGGPAEILPDDRRCGEPERLEPRRRGGAQPAARRAPGGCAGQRHLRRHRGERRRRGEHRRAGKAGGRRRRPERRRRARAQRHRVARHAVPLRAHRGRRHWFDARRVLRPAPRAGQPAAGSGEAVPLARLRVARRARRARRRRRRRRRGGSGGGGGGGGGT